MRSPESGNAMPARVRYAALSYAAAGCTLASVMVGALLFKSGVPTGLVVMPPIIEVSALPAIAPPGPALSLEQATLSFWPEEVARPMEMQPAVAPPPAAPARMVTRPHQSPPPPPVAAATVTISDEGISPKIVSLVSGGTITWVNKGSRVHTATRELDSPYRLDSGGLAAGQRFSITLFDPGTYRYTSAPDCLASNRRPAFDCSSAIVNVAPPPSPARSLAIDTSVAAPTTAAVNITDRGFLPDKLVIKAGGSVTWTNQGTNVHTATAVGPVRPFDSGGLAAHQEARTMFSSPGTFAYSSAPDCLNGNHNAQFDCGRSFEVTVLTG